MIRRRLRRGLTVIAGVCPAGTRLAARPWPCLRSPPTTPGPSSGRPWWRSGSRRRARQASSARGLVPARTRRAFCRAGPRAPPPRSRPTPAQRPSSRPPEAVCCPADWPGRHPSPAKDRAPPGSARPARADRTGREALAAENRFLAIASSRPGTASFVPSTASQTQIVPRRLGRPPSRSGGGSASGLLGVGTGSSERSSTSKKYLSAKRETSTGSSEESICSSGSGNRRLSASTWSSVRRLMAANRCASSGSAA